MPSSYLFVLGRTPELSYQELCSLYPHATITRVNSSLIIFEQADFEPQKAMQRLGGTITIATLVGELANSEAEAVASLIDRVLPPGKITFSLSHLTQELPQSRLSEVKSLLSDSGRHVRFIANTSGIVLSAAVIKGQSVQEFLFVEHENKTWCFLTVAVQPIDDWSKRDFGRPHADPKRGMLPPKVARMAVNIITGLQGEKSRILDPFCGMGTICSEAYLVGATAYGSDIVEEVVAKAKENAAWLIKQYPGKSDNPPTFAVSDAVHVSAVMKEIDAIVTEPFLGSPSFAHDSQLTTDKVKNTVRGLEKLYIGCLREWKKILKPRGLVLMALPQFTTQTHVFFVKKVIDSCENLGYSIEVGPLEYGRPQAVVKRQFYLLKRKE